MASRIGLPGPTLAVSNIAHMAVTGQSGGLTGPVEMSLIS
jgi:hypothetical protein